MRKFYIVIFVFGLFSCTAKEQKKQPVDLIGKEQFADILKDIRLLEGAYTSRYAKVDSSAFKIDSYYIKLFSDHGISRDRFLTSYAFYFDDLNLMMEIEDDVINKVTIMQTEQDSINRLLNTVTLDSINSKLPVPDNH